MSRISKADVNKALDRVGKLIIDAGGADKRVSRADLQKALGSLDGVEKKLVDVFYKFVDHRDFKTGNTITAKDVERAVAYAKETLVAKYDVNGNGLSKSEIAKMSLTGKLAVELARELKKADVDPDPQPTQPSILQPGESYYLVREGVKVTSEERITSADGVDATLEKQIITACLQSTYDHVKTLQDAFDAVDQGEFVVRNFEDPATGKKYVGIDYGAGDSTYGAIFEVGQTTPAFSIQDGELYAP